MRFEATHRRRPAGSARLRIDARRIVLTDEPISFRLVVSALESNRSRAVVLEELQPAGWRAGDTLWSTGQPLDTTREVTLTEGVTAIRCRLDPRVGKAAQFTDPLFVDVRGAPPILTLFSMGGAWTGAPDPPDGSPNAQADLEPHGIRVDEDLCRLHAIPSGLIRALTTNRNVQCNDLCDEECVNFFEHLALRLMNDEGLADELRSIRGFGFCHSRSNDKGLRNRIILGKWENSELEPIRPDGRTWEQILDTYRSGGGRYVILLGQSHGGAKFAGMVRDHWRWDNDLKIVLFVSWDSADLGGGVSSVGDRPETVLAFFQRGDLAHWQNGKHIEQATEEHDLTDHLSHNAIARSEFVHDKTATFIRDAISSIRGRSRGGSAATFRMDADGSLGEEIEVRRLHPTFSVARAFRLGAADCMCLLGTSDGHVQIRRLTDHGLLGGVVRDSAVSPGFTAGAIYTVGDLTFILLVNDSNEEATVREIRPDGSLGAQRYPSSPQQRVTGPLKGPWDHADAFRIGNEQFLCVAKTNGGIRVVRVDADGRPTTIVQTPPSGSFLPNPTPSSILSMTVFALGANVYLFTTGDGLSTFRINADGSIGARVFHESTPLGQLAFSTTAHLGVGGDHSMLLLDAVGRMQVRRVNANGSLGQTLSAGQTGRTGRNSLATFVSDGRGHAFLLRRPS